MMPQAVFRLTISPLNAVHMNLTAIIVKYNFFSDDAPATTGAAAATFCLALAREFAF